MAGRPLASCCARTSSHDRVMSCSIRTTTPARAASSTRTRGLRPYCSGTSSGARCASRASSEQLLSAVADAARRFGVAASDAGVAGGQALVPRPPHWGGYRLWAESVELWVEGAARIHDRARWSRELVRESGRILTGPWSVTRLQP